jgi:predicted DNA-binding transcriptional regulator AlpA
MQLMSIREVAAFFGGQRPLNPSTVYRLIRKGILPRPIKVSEGTSRWRRDEVEAALAKMTEARS